MPATKRGVAIDVHGVHFAGLTVPLITPIKLVPKPLSERTAQEIALAAYLGAIFDTKGYIVVDKAESRSGRPRLHTRYKPYLMINITHEATLAFVQELVGNDVGWLTEFDRQYRFRIRNATLIMDFISIVTPFVVARQHVLLTAAALLQTQVGSPGTELEFAL